MKPADIRAIARRQHQRQVALVQWRHGQAFMRIVIRPGGEPGAAIVDAAGHDLNLVPEAEAPVTVRAEALGILRWARPPQPSTVPAPGDAVRAGQSLALLQVGETYTAVAAPCDGSIESVLAAEGERIDYGRPLFLIKPQAR